MTANRSVRTGLTASAVISVSKIPDRPGIIANHKRVVLALVDCTARLFIRRI
jgi:hypothetical protein